MCLGEWSEKNIHKNWELDVNQILKAGQIKRGSKMNMCEYLATEESKTQY